MIPLLGESLELFRCNASVVSRVMFALKQVARRGGTKAMEDARGFEPNIKKVLASHVTSKGINREGESLLKALVPRDAK